MSLGYVTGFKVFEAATTLGKREGYYHGFLNIGSQTDRHHYCMGGQPSQVAIDTNQAPALANGSIKKLISSVYVNGGGRLDLFSAVNAVAVLEGNNPSLGKVTLDFDRPFVTNDLLGWQSQRNNTNGTLTSGCFIELEFSEDENIKHWYGGHYSGGFLSNTFWQIGEMTRHAIFPLTDEIKFQTPMQLSGTILDYGYYGTSPTSADNTPIWDLRKNGVSVVTNVLSQTGGSRTFQNFVGVDEDFAVDDKINLMGRSASSTVAMSGIATMRIRFDID